MSDGDGATPGRPHSGDGGSALPGGAATPDATASTDNDGLTRSRRAKPLAAPWEREIDTSKRESRDYEQTGPVTVADLIAKINGEAPPTEPKRHRAADDDNHTTETAGRAPEPVSEPEPEPYPDTGDFDTTILPVIDPPTSEIPDLTALRPARRTPAPRLLTHHRAVVVGRVAAALAAVLALVLTGGAWQWQSAKNNLLNRVSALDPDSRDIVDPNAQFGDENFLIVGTDSRLGDNAEIGAGTTEDAAGARSDTVMLVNIPANRKRVVAVSFPRDLEIEPMKCEPWDPETREYGPIQDPESPMYGKEQVYTEYKLNSAFAVGGP